MKLPIINEVKPWLGFVDNGGLEIQISGDVLHGEVNKLRFVMQEGCVAVLKPSNSHDC